MRDAFGWMLAGLIFSIYLAIIVIGAVYLANNVHPGIGLAWIIVGSLIIREFGRSK